MSLSPSELRDLVAFFSAQSSSSNIVSLALEQINQTATTPIATDASDVDVEYDEAFAAAAAAGTVAAAAGNGSYVEWSNRTVARTVSRIGTEMPMWLIPCYSVILLFAIVGNLLVISTLVQNRRMRTITNLFLLNLAISDILLGVLCMPVTLVGTLLRHFIFGEFLCKLIQFSQAASVAVSSWTLVAISCERYYAICHPLRSRTWQTISHAYKIIAFIWLGSIVCMTPIAMFSQLMPTSRQGLRKCREHWPSGSIGYERSYNIFLDLALLVLPLIILCVAYILITRTLYVGMKQERAMIFGGGTGGGSGAGGGGGGGSSAGSGGGSHVITQIGGTQVEAVAVRASSSICNFDTSLLRCPEPPNGRNGSVIASASHGNGRNQADTDAAYQLRRKQQEQQPKHDYDDISNASSGRKLLAPSEGRVHLYCIRSSSVKSLHRNINTNSNNNDSRSASSIGMAASPTPSMTVIHVPPHQQRSKLQPQRQRQHPGDEAERRKSVSTPSLRITEAALRRSNVAKNLESKRRVVKMLFVLVLEFFICWTPLYVINTVAMFIGPAIYEYIDYASISFFQLLAYSSSCCNPITYCFMNAGFRRAFLDTFKGLQLSSGRLWRRRRHKSEMHLSMAGNSMTLATNATVVSHTTMLDSPRL